MKSNKVIKCFLKEFTGYLWVIVSRCFGNVVNQVFLRNPLPTKHPFFPSSRAPFDFWRKQTNTHFLELMVLTCFAISRVAFFSSYAFTIFNPVKNLFHTSTNSPKVNNCISSSNSPTFHSVLHKLARFPFLPPHFLPHNCTAESVPPCTTLSLILISLIISWSCWGCSPRTL